MATNILAGIFAGSSSASPSFHGADVRAYQTDIPTRGERSKLIQLRDREEAVHKMRTDFRNPLTRRAAVERYADAKLEELPAADERTAILVEAALDPRPFNGQGRLGQIDEWMKECYLPIAAEASDILRELNGRLAARIEGVIEEARSELAPVYARFGCAGALDACPVLIALHQVLESVRTSASPDFKLGQPVAQAVHPFLRE